ncbi:MAG TPA: ABC transporter permease [Rhizomicrobium sp.]|nr:ABC transporter permease [Rhizomicrobium sp.]
MRAAGGFWTRYRRNRPAVAGLAIVLMVVALGLLAPLLYPGDPWSIVGQPFLWPGDPHAPLLGTDVLGRDIASGVLHGARVSLRVGLFSALFAGVIGTIVGSVAGYYAGWVDDVLMRITEAFQTVPSFLTALIIVALFKPSIPTIIAAIAIVSWPGVARLVRAETLRLRGSDFVSACVTFGMSDIRIIITQILPNCLAPLIVMVSVMIASAILIEAGLSFLGLSDPSQLSWGTMIATGRDALRSAWYMSAIPGIAILVTVLGINLVSEGLNDAFNPGLRQRQVAQIPRQTSRQA